MVTEEGSYLRHIDFCITQLKAQGPSRTCNESKEEEEKINLGDDGRHAAPLQCNLLHECVLLVILNHVCSKVRCQMKENKR